jgi:hypothetical protein
MSNKNRLFVGWILTTSFSAAAFAQGKGVWGSFNLVEAGLTTNEPVHVELKVENHLLDGIVIDLGLNRRGNFKLSLVRPGGQAATPPSPIVEFGADGKVHVDADRSFTISLLLNRWFKFDVPGRYILDIAYVGPIETQSGSQVYHAMDGHVVIDVGPRNPERLREVCEELVRRSLGSPTYATAIGPAETMSYIRDPIAVPFLTRLLEQNSMLHRAVTEGLLRIGDDTSMH